MSKDQTPKADGLRAMREASRGHLQATAEAPAGYVDGAQTKTPLPSKPLIPYAGKERHQGGVPFTKTPRPPNDKPPRNRRKHKRKIA